MYREAAASGRERERIPADLRDERLRQVVAPAGGLASSNHETTRDPRHSIVEALLAATLGSI